MQEQANAKRPFFSFKNCCIGSIIIFLIIPAIIVIIGLYLVHDQEKKDRQKFENRGKPESYSLLFSKYLVPDYSFSAEEQSQIDTLVLDTMNMQKPAGLGTSKEIIQNGGNIDLEAKDKKSAAKELVTKLKEQYPEGYFVIAKSLTLLPEKDKYSFNFFFLNNDLTTANVEVHELSHSWGSITTGSYFASGRNFNFSTNTGHLIEDKMVVYKNYTFPLPRGEEVLKYLPTPTSIDNKYLKDANQDLYSTLDEVNSYIKSLRVARTYNYYDNEDINSSSSAVVLSRQLYILSLQLKNLKENHPEIWKSHTKNPGFAYVMMRLIEIAKNELTVAKDEGLDYTKGDENTTSTIEKNLELVNQNQPLFDEIYKANDIDKYQGKDLSGTELKSLGITVEVIK